MFRAGSGSATTAPRSRTSLPALGYPDILGAKTLRDALADYLGRVRGGRRTRPYPLLEGRSLGWPAWIWLLLAACFAGLLAPDIVEEHRGHARVAPLLRTSGVSLCCGGLLMTLGTLGVLLGASHVGHGSDPWPFVPGPVVCGVGLSVGTVFFDRLGRHGFTSPFNHATPVVIGLFLAAAALSLVLPSTAVGEQELADI